MISIRDNVVVAADVTFLEHDLANIMLNDMPHTMTPVFV